MVLKNITLSITLKSNIFRYKFFELFVVSRDNLIIRISSVRHFQISSK